MNTQHINFINSHTIISIILYRIIVYIEISLSLSLFSLTDVAQSTPVQILLKLGATVQWSDRGLTPDPEWNQNFTL